MSSRDGPPRGAGASGGNDRRWAELMAAAQGGDGRAYERLLREIVPFVRAIAAARHRRQDSVDDVVQDVLLTLHRVRHTYDPARSFRHWLATIARRRSIDLLRRRTRTQAIEVSDPVAYQAAADPAGRRAAEAQDAVEELRDVVADLPQRQRQALEMLKLRALSLREASLASGLSIAALKVNVHRAIKALRRRLRGE
jgi:RNA polymerase sigma factor (sigma-70 family)